MNELLQVARLGKTVGLKGGLRLYNLSDFPTQFKKGAKFLLENGEILEICSFNRENSVVVLSGFIIEVISLISLRKIPFFMIRMAVN